MHPSCAACAWATRVGGGSPDPACLPPPVSASLLRPPTTKQCTPTFTACNAPHTCSPQGSYEDMYDDDEDEEQGGRFKAFSGAARTLAGALPARLWCRWRVCCCRAGCGRCTAPAAACRRRLVGGRSTKACRLLLSRTQAVRWRRRSSSRASAGRSAAPLRLFSTQTACSRVGCRSQRGVLPCDCLACSLDAQRTMACNCHGLPLQACRPPACPPQASLLPRPRPRPRSGRRRAALGERSRQPAFHGGHHAGPAAAGAGPG